MRNIADLPRHSIRFDKEVGRTGRNTYKGLRVADIVRRIIKYRGEIFRYVFSHVPANRVQQTLSHAAYLEEMKRQLLVSYHNIHRTEDVHMEVADGSM